MKPQPILLIFHLLSLLQVSLSQNACSQLPGVLHAHVSEQSRKDAYQLGETILYTCDTGFTSDLPIKYVCSSEGWVTLRQESCYPPTASCERPSPHEGLRITGLPENNGPISPGHVLIFGCDDPVKRVNGSSVLICDRDGQWNKPVPSCEVMTCPPVRVNDNVQVSGDPEDGTHGNVLRFSCKSDSQILKGPTEIYCNKKGEWSGNVPECTAVKCESLTVNDNVQVSGDPEDGTYGNVIRFSCKSRNQILKGPTEIYCDESGEWSGNVPECKEVSCDTPQIPHGRVTDPPKVYRENEHLTFVCDNKYKPADDRRSRCLKVGSEAVWSPTPQCTLIQCKVNLPPIPGTRYNRYDKNMFPPGDTLTVTCDGDRWIVDMKTTSAVVTCNDNGNWDIIPECKDVSCHDRRDPYLLSFNDYWGRRKMNDRVPYSCKRGYEKPSGVTYATCTRDGWMPERLCEGTTCEKPDFEHGEQITSRVKHSYNNGETLTYQCVYQTDIIPVTITCDRGSWSGFKSCLELACVKPKIPNGFAIGPHDNTVYYSCNQNYKLFSKAWWGVAKCSNGKWSTLQECIEITECGETPDISNGRVASIDKQRATITCSEGYQAEINEITCDNGEWDLDERNYTNVCTRISEPCDPPPQVQNAVIETPYQREYNSGTQVIYKCRDSYKLGNDKAIKCLNGLWEEKKISCTPFCKELEDSKMNVEQSLRRGEYMNGDTIDYRCAHAEENEGTATCYEGKWTKTIECPGIPCNVPQLGPGLRTSPIIPRVKSGEKLNVFCNSEYELEGANEIECLDTGLWSSTFPTCTKTCEMPDLPRFLRQVTPVEGTRAKKGQKLKFECSQRGKFIQGNAEIECLESGEWSDQLPRCGDARTCSAPPAIEFGDVMGSKPEYQEGESAEYTCPRYYLMEGGPRRTCRSGQWTGRVRCIKPCTVTKEEMNKHNLQFLKHWLDKIYSEHNDHITFRCKEGKRPDGRVEMRQQCVEGVIELPTCV